MAKKKSVSKKEYYYAKGRRKKSTATVRLYNGNGDDTINKKKASELYSMHSDITLLYKPFTQTDTKGDFHFSAKVSGGGISGQLDAIVLALSRALVKANDEFRTPLKKAKLLRVDSRIKERKKPGRKKARKKQQFSKR